MIEIKKQEDNMYCFSLKTKTGHTLLNSITFSSKVEIKKTIAKLNPLIEQQSIFERKTNTQGEFLFNLKNEKGEIIGISKSYGSEAGMENGIKNLKNRITSLMNTGEL